MCVRHRCITIPLRQAVVYSSHLPAEVNHRILREILTKTIRRPLQSLAIWPSHAGVVNTNVAVRPAAALAAAMQWTGQALHP